MYSYGCNHLKEYECPFFAQRQSVLHLDHVTMKLIINFVLCFLEKLPQKPLGQIRKLGLRMVKHTFSALSAVILNQTTRLVFIERIHY